MDFRSLILGIPAVLLALSIHEYAHGAVADRLGDPTPRYQGRLTLNPLAHLDPIGGLMLLLFHFGWAKPVQVNPNYFKQPRKGMMLVGLAGPLANVTLAYGLALLWGLLPLNVFSSNLARAVADLVFFTIQINLWLAAFNLIPIPPLDGSRILAGLLPSRWAYYMDRIEPYGWLILILLIMSGWSQRLLYPIYRLLISGLRLF